MRNGDNLINKPFGCLEGTTIAWELHVYPNGKGITDIGCVSFFLQQTGLQDSKNLILVEFQIYTLDVNSAKVHMYKNINRFINQQEHGLYQITQNYAMTALKNDGSLLVICEIEYSSPKPKISVEQEVKAEPLDEKNE
ncbi:hypothetical protein LOAG_13836, partial [Loa loa]